MRYEVFRLDEIFKEVKIIGNNARLTVYLADNSYEIRREKHPCILICPGGGYGHCSRTEGEPVALHFLPEGYHVFVLNYSVAPHTFPMQLCEVAAAMELIYQNAETWCCDTDRIAIMGFSAGGHLAAHYSNCYDWPEVRKAFPESKKVNATVLCYPVISADPKVAHLGSFHNLLGHENLSPEEAERFSCQNHVTEHTPPTFLWHKSTDKAVPVVNSLLYAQALAEHSVSFAMHIYPAGGHGLAAVNDRTNSKLESSEALAHDWLDAAKKWLGIVFPEEQK